MDQIPQRVGKQLGVEDDPPNTLEEPGSPAVELTDVVKAFDDVVAVDGVSLRVREGEFLSLLGPSGCGKTTTLRLIAGFERPDRGRVSVGGDDVTHTPPSRRNVNTVFQHYALFPHYTVWENVAYGLRARKVAGGELRRRVVESLQSVQLEGLEDRRPHQLSGGQQQRVALARALVLRPAVLLLDEPLGALDLKLRQQMQIKLKSLQEQVHLTFIYVTHDQGEAFVMSDRVAVMQQGAIVQVGSPRELYEQPNSRYVADFVGDSILLDGLLQEWNEGVARVDVGTGSVLARHEDPIPSQQAVTVMVRPERVVLLDGGADACALHGRIDRVVYGGALLDIHVRLANGRLVRVCRQGTKLSDLPPWLENGQEIVLSWASEDARILFV